LTINTINLQKFSEEANQELCISLLKAESEEDVVEILGPLLDDVDLWKPVGNRWGNHNIIGDQQSDATSSLIENIVNSNDAILIDKCLREGIDPVSEKAPQSMPEAMERYFKMKDGDPTSIPSKDRIKLSEKIGLVATGDKKYPSIACFDQGIGQNSDDFWQTFLSLPGTKEVVDKSGIPFVQGLFNMGSTGVLPFCGKPQNDYNFKLVLSKRDPSVPNADGEWGFTIIRKIPPIKKHTMSTYVYLAPKDQILSFKADSLPILPGKYPNAYGMPFEFGTYVKLYNYQLERPSIIVLHLLFEISHQLFLPALPVRIFERRTGFETSHTLTHTMHGDFVRLAENENKIMEKGFPMTHAITIPDIGEMSVTIYVLKRSERGKDWLGARGAHRVIFTVNGQMHDSKREEFLSSEKVDKSYIAPDVLVVVNCDDITDLAREKIFMPSRDRTRKNVLKDDRDLHLQDLLKNHEGLIELDNLRRSEELEQARSNSKLLKSLINKLIKRSVAFSRLFGSGLDIELPYDFKWKKVKRKKYEPNYFPTFFRIKGDKKLFEITPKRGASIFIETDAPNDYFFRKNDKGRGPYIFPKRFSYSHSIWNGMMRMYLKPKAVLKPGTEIPVSIAIRDKQIDDPFELKFKVKVLASKETPPPNPKEIWSSQKTFNLNEVVEWDGESWVSLENENFGNEPDSSPDWWAKKQKKKTSKNFGREKIEIEGGEPQPMKSLPPYTFVYKDDDNWKSHEFDEGTGAHLVTRGDSFDFFINLDNKYYLEEYSRAKSGEHELLQEQYVWGLLLQSLAMIYEIKQKYPNLENTSIATAVTLASRGIAMSIIPTIKELSKNILR